MMAPIACCIALPSRGFVAMTMGRHQHALQKTSWRSICGPIPLSPITCGRFVFHRELLLARALPSASMPSCSLHLLIAVACRCRLQKFTQRGGTWRLSGVPTRGLKQRTSLCNLMRHASSSGPDFPYIGPYRGAETLPWGRDLTEDISYTFLTLSLHFSYTFLTLFLHFSYTFLTDLR